MSFQESFANITSEQFKNGICRLYIQEYPFTVELTENNIEIKFPFNQKQGAYVYSLSEEIKNFFCNNSEILNSEQDLALEQANELDIAIVNAQTHKAIPPQTEKKYTTTSSRRYSQSASIKARKIALSENAKSGSLEFLNEQELFSHEWDGMFYYISFFASPNAKTAALCVKLLETIAEFLKAADIEPDVCALCGEKGAQSGFIIEGALCAAHMQCASGRSSKRSLPRLICAYLTAAAFCAVAALSFIPLCRYNIMPSVAGIPMGLLGALGFWLMDKKNAPNRWIMLIIYAVLGSAANFCGDYLFLIQSGSNFDFVATFTYSLNIINSVFDIICCVIIAHFSSIIIYDLLYKKLSIRKPDKKLADHQNAR